ncbi:efflux RND transporter periplasmic adaptor subunit [Flavihumibacter stibioxidans]|uniref:Uncharacterized protein n=1 Tax=Flavihumibacter stibioxidans TaxID=1834163 RepID=A0ABR7MCP2_9BACT|nr:efflux RND transporter periplasmic adaptor subunit [Flavihumibacter stibioxidans]MBC6492795.1 hypothetical protein [Flavihumibacter stibioxidans]
MQTFIRKFRPLLIAVIPASLLLSCGSTDAASKIEKTTSTQIPANLPVDVIIAEANLLNQSELIAGTILPEREVEVMSELTKKINEVSFTDGSYVQKGQLLYKLDDADIRAKIRQLQAELNLASINERRLHALLQTETVRQEEYDIASTKLQSMEAGLQALEVELSKTFIRAPFSGRIGISKVHPGTLVSPGMPMVTLQDQATVKISFAVPEKHLAAARPGNSIRFKTDHGKEEWTAKIVATEAGVNPDNRNIELIALAENGNGLLKPGMSVKILFTVSSGNESGILLPTESLIPGVSGYMVFIVKNGTATMRPVTVGNRNEKEATITAGLEHGDTVMVSNLLRASEGIPVAIVSKK